MNAVEAEESYKELRERYQDLTKNQNKLEIEINAKRKELNDVELERTEYTSKLASLQTGFSEIFTEKFHSQQEIGLHPIVKNSIVDSTCEICGATGPEVTESIESDLKNGICPLCGIKIKETPADVDGIEALKELDIKISEAKKTLDTINKSRKRLNAELSNFKLPFSYVNMNLP